MHGAGSGPWVFDSWAPPEGVAVTAVDLQDGIDVASASMDDYARALVAACGPLPRPLALCGWSMGGLVAMMAARDVEPDVLVLIEPSAPVETQGAAAAGDATGTFDPEIVYGRFPDRIPSRPESERARADRKRGISIPALPRRSLVVFGDEFEHERGRALADHYGIDSAHFPGLSHWDLVLSPAVHRRIFSYVTGG
ncbi:MAG TPA: alpha/beta fold hydrolase [Actinomycetota bacterium]|nr:alpha/beta fold hydrolase [Actinomycetota bacterium]